VKKVVGVFVRFRAPLPWIYTLTLVEGNISQEREEVEQNILLAITS
jgi:hypothetical protein